jgi:hypothetical protein
MNGYLEEKLREFKLQKATLINFLEDHEINTPEDVDSFNASISKLGNLEYQIIQFEKKIVRQTQNLLEK